MQNKDPSIESYVKVLTKFQNDFKLNPDKIIAPLDFVFLQAVKEVYSCPVQTSHYFYVKYLHKVAHGFGIRNRRNINQLK